MDCPKEYYTRQKRAESFQLKNIETLKMDSSKGDYAREREFVFPIQKSQTLNMDFLQREYTAGEGQSFLPQSGQNPDLGAPPGEYTRC